MFMTVRWDVRRQGGPGAVRKRVVIVAIVLLVFVAAANALWRIHKSRTFQFFGEIIHRVETTEPVVALTFDDGPTTEHTEKVLAMLDDLGIRATFFVIGAQMADVMAVGKQLAAAGHELGNHTYSHSRGLILRSAARFADEIEQTDALIRQAGYQGPIHFRPPYGKKLFTGPWYLARTGRKTITWDVAPDAQAEVASSAERITAHVLEYVRPGSIILLHVHYASNEPARQAIRPIVAGLQARGYRLVTVSELLTLR